MKLRLLTIRFFVTFCFFSSVQAQQSAFFDALFLKNNCIVPAAGITTATFKNKADVLKVLHKYYPGKTDSQIEADIKNNPFYGIYDPSGGFKSGSSTASFTDLAGKAGGLDVTNFAVGLADFLIDRTKEEVYVNFFLQFKEFLDCHPEFKHLFPNTYQLLENFQYWNYANVLVTIREALDKDMKDMMLHMAEFRNIDNTWCAACPCDKTVAGTGKQKVCYDRIAKYKAAFNDDKARVVFAGLVLGDGFLKDTKIPNLIQNVADDNTINNFTDPNITNGIKLMAVLSSSFASNEDNRNYVKAGDLPAATDTIFWNIFLGLVYQQIELKNIQFTVGTTSTPLTTSFKAQVPDASKILPYINDLQSSSESILATINSLKKAKAEGNKDLVPLMSNLFQESSKLIRHASDLGFISIPAAAKGKIDTTIAIAEMGFDLANAITDKNYQRAVLDAMNITLQIASFGPGADNNPYVQNLVKYGSFAANVVSAKSPADVKGAIQAIALPVGSASIKKNLKYNIGLNAYVGGTGGYELNFADKSKSGASFALYAPIGINFNFGNIKNRDPKTVSKKYSGAFSIQLNVLDIGSIISYRLKGEGQTESNQLKVRLENIFAPGLNLIGGFPKVPLSLGFGTQWMPTLSRMDGGNLSFVNNTGMRFHAFLAIDIPVINVWSSSHKNDK